MTQSLEQITHTQGPEADRYGRYEIVEKLASGGMGEVFLARSGGVAGFQKFVVIKKILPHLLDQPQFVEGLVREAKLLVMLDHPNIVQVLDLGVEGNDYFMAMEFVNGYNMATVAHYCAQNRVLIPANAVAAIGLGVLAGLDYAHQLTTPDGQRQNIIHRDVSPQNVMISRDGRVKLTDFGIAKVLNEAEGEVTQSLKGKFRYMAPEAVDGGRVDRRYDIFATGILLFEGLCRRHLFGGRSDVDILNQVREAKVPAIERYHPNVPKAMVEVTRRALVKKPEKRYQSASEFARELREAIQPVAEADAQNELAAFIAELYERPDFPVNKPKLPDLHAVGQDVTRSVVLESHIPEQRRDVAAIPGERVPVAPTASRLVLWLILLMLVILTGAVSYLFLSGGTSNGVAAPPLKVDGVLIDVEKRDAKVPVDLPPPPAADSGRKDTKRPPPPCRTFSAAVGGRAVYKRKRALAACMAKAAPGQAVVLKWEILRSGRVSRRILEPKAVVATPLGRCLLRAAGRVRFRCHTKSVVTYRQRLSRK